jgi:hypothetical protein
MPVNAAALATAVDKTLPTLVERNGDWAKLEVGTERHLLLSMPLENLLAAPDQAAAITDFVTKALEDLNVTGFFQILKENLSENSTPSS